MSTKLKFTIAVALQIAVLTFIIIYKTSISLGGTEVILKIEPYDPRDPFRGDYITFRYSDLSTLPGHYYEGNYGQELQKKDTVYITLEPVSFEQGGNHFRPVKISEQKPDDETIAIKGTVESLNYSNFGTEESTKYLDTISVIYGIEEYFIPEGTGQNIFFDDKETAAKVAIDENGNAVLKEIYIDGKLWP